MQVILFYKIMFFVFGLLVGSFLNALIFRIPRGYNIALPRSFCPNCKKVINWYENIPIISFFVLRMACSGCGNKISFRYPSIELVVALFSLYLAPINLGHYNLITYIFYFSVFCIFIVHFFIDLDFQILPNSLNLILGIMFLIYGTLFHPWWFWVYGSAIGLGLPLFVTWFFYITSGKIGMGGGDIKLYACLGFILGPFGIVYNISFSSLLGAIIGGLWLIINKKGKNEPFPFGPFIIVVAFLQIFFPDLFSIVLFF